LKLKILIRRLAFSGLEACLLGWVCAAPARGANPDTMQVTVTPGNITYGVQITSDSGVGYNFGSVDMGASTVSTKAIGVKNTGNISAYFSISISNSQPDGWTPINSGVPGNNQFLMFSRLQTTGASQPASAAFDVNLDTATASVPSVAAGRYGQASKTPPDTSKDLWLKLIMPATVTTASGQSMVLTINGQAN
jgi:hypothetical protein